MKLETTEQLLKRFNYTYQKNNQELVINMDFSHRIAIDFSNPDNITITDRLVPWNFLTGIIPMSFKNAVLLNLVVAVVLSIIISFLNTLTALAVFIAFMIWISLWSMFYITKSENLKQLLINWNYQ